MAFDLSFDPSFFFNEGEPYDVNVEPSDRPTSVWQAIHSIHEVDREELANYMGVESKYLTPERILDIIQETSTCTDLSVPVKVWIDRDGLFTIKVY